MRQTADAGRSTYDRSQVGRTINLPLSDEMLVRSVTDSDCQTLAGCLALQSSVAAADADDDARRPLRALYERASERVSLR